MNEQEIREEFDTWNESVGFIDSEYIRCAWEVWQFRQKEIDSLQAKLDSLMLEYCPEYMEDAQLLEWERNQQPVEEEVEDWNIEEEIK